MERESPSHDHPGFTITNEAYAEGLCRSEVGDQDLESFLREDSVYDSTEKRWPFPEAPATRADLVSSVLNVIDLVVAVFGKATREGIERGVIEMGGYEEAGEGPALVVRAAESFEVPKSPNPPSEFGYSNIATYFSVKLERDVQREKVCLEEMAAYARRIFREQPNRIHVRPLVITEKHARLHPETLVRLVAGLSSTNERTLGLDDSIQWTIDDGRKSQGTLATTSPSGERKTFPILEQIPIPRDSISGRATTCWRVQDPDTQEEFLMKDSWRPGDRVAEYELLELAKGVPGVVQMVAYEPGRGETKDFRCPSTAGKFLNRIATRLTMKCCGGLIESFKSTLQLLCALCDAIAGHQRLVGDDIRILHRDISPNNILLGRDDASEGDRGVLIDFDLAFKATAEHPVVVIDHNIGTRVFQSLSVVESFCIRMNKHQHDYLDDLESFLYVLTYIFLCFRPDGSCVPSKDEGLLIISEWAAHDPETAASNKRCLFGFGGGLRHRIRGGREVLGSCVYLAV
ncbi:hypothetical protein FA13DRAFT_1816940 [Coprinellus micaceus]|uniref:Fungal-type protein kinase domain-containing protein n=1 Tax=Coprinellus micaceus TaxID=71717 RepID=A0A4Y7SY04_COPMI|nr:hypothetical protein FA13DRAFT_1816940 [Coprinellus micaceus]